MVAFSHAAKALILETLAFGALSNGKLVHFGFTSQSQADKAMWACCEQRQWINNVALMGRNSLVHDVGWVKMVVQNTVVPQNHNGLLHSIFNHDL